MISATGSLTSAITATPGGDNNANPASAPAFDAVMASLAPTTTAVGAAPVTLKLAEVPGAVSVSSVVDDAVPQSVESEVVSAGSEDAASDTPADGLTPDGDLFAIMPSFMAAAPPIAAPVANSPAPTLDVAITAGASSPALTQTMSVAGRGAGTWPTSGSGITAQTEAAISAPALVVPTGGSGGTTASGLALAGSGVPRVTGALPDTGAPVDQPDASRVDPAPTGQTQARGGEVPPAATPPGASARESDSDRLAASVPAPSLASAFVRADAGPLVPGSAETSATNVADTALTSADRPATTSGRTPVLPFGNLAAGEISQPGGAVPHATDQERVARGADRDLGARASVRTAGNGLLVASAGAPMMSGQSAPSDGMSVQQAASPWSVDAGASPVTPAGPAADGLVTVPAGDQGAAAATGLDLDAIFPSNSNAPLTVAFVRPSMPARSVTDGPDVAALDGVLATDPAAMADAAAKTDVLAAANVAFALPGQPNTPVQASTATDATAAAAPADTVVQHHLDLAHDGAWLDRLAHDIAASADKESRMRFQLNPERLGALQVEIRQQADGAFVRFSADSEAARAMIADAQPTLVAEARAQGMRIADTQVNLSNQNGSFGASPQGGSANAFAQQQSSQQQSGQPQRAFDRAATPSTGAGLNQPAARAVTRSERYA